MHFARTTTIWLARRAAPPIVIVLRPFATGLRKRNARIVKLDQHTRPRRVIRVRSTPLARYSRWPLADGSCAPPQFWGVRQPHGCGKVAIRHGPMPRYGLTGISNGL